jgi:hypothetical protein
MCRFRHTVQNPAVYRHPDLLSDITNGNKEVDACFRYRNASNGGARCHCIAQATSAEDTQSLVTCVQTVSARLTYTEGSHALLMVTCTSRDECTVVLVASWQARLSCASPSPVPMHTPTV